MNNYINVYLLLYKVKNYPQIWIVKLSDDYIELKSILKHFKKNEKIIGNYYIIRSTKNKLILKERFKQFQIYKYNSEDELVYSL